MTDNITNTEQSIHNESLAQIPQNQIISYLRRYFEVNNPNISPPDINYLFNHYNNRLLPINQDQDEEDKDENEDSNGLIQEEYIQYHHLQRQYTGEEDDDLEGKCIVSSLFVVNQSYESSNDFNSSTQEDYFDFRVYPLNINWYQIENSDSHYFDILEHYGNFGVATLTSVSHADGIEIFPDDFIYSILSHYYSLVTQQSDANSNANAKGDGVNAFIHHLPSLKGIRDILNQRMIAKKELICIKTVIDIHDHYLRTYNKGLNRFTLNEVFMPLICLFYSLLTENEVEFIYDAITNQMKKTHSIISKSPLLIHILILS